MTNPAGLSAAESSRFFGHPTGLRTLFMTELWERFSFYGMRALLTLYLVAPPDGATPPGPGLGMDQAEATAVYGTYIALVYVFPLAGGWIADRIWGARRAVFVGGVIIAAGHFMMAVPVAALFWVGLLTVAIGTGLLKPCVSAIVGGLYGPDDVARRDAGFSIFYMGINLGAFIAPIVTGWLANDVNWHVGFAAAGVGMTIGLVQYALGAKHLGTAGSKPVNPAPPEMRRRAGLGALAALVAFAAAIGAISWLRGGFSIPIVVDALGLVILAIPVIYFWRLFRNPGLSTGERNHVKAYVFLFIGAAAFWMIADQAGSTMSLFASEHTDRSIAGWQMPASWLLSVNPILIIVFAPVFAALWTRLGSRAPSTPVKFGIALLGVGGSFGIMVLPGLMADDGQASSIWWIIGVYLLQTWAELLLSPTGLSATTALAPEGMESQLLALWFLAVAVGDTIGGHLLGALDGFGLGGYFGIVGAMAAAVGVFLLLVSPRVKRLMGGVA